MLSALALLLLAAMLLSSALASGYVETTGSVNMRSGPGLNYRSLGTVNQGTTLTYLNRYSTDTRGVIWYMVSYRNSTAWVSSVYSELYGASIVTYLYATGGKSYVRNAPNLNGKILTTFQKGDSAEYQNASSVDERGVTWYKIYYNGKTGWVSSRYTSFEESVRRVYAENGNTNFRTAPNLNGTVLGVLYKGESMAFTEITSVDNRGVTWYQVKEDGVIGWVSSRYTEVY